MQLGIVAKWMLSGFLVSEWMKSHHSSVTTKVKRMSGFSGRHEFAKIHHRIYVASSGIWHRHHVKGGGWFGSEGTRFQ
ncbi:hypothetical protein OIU77_002435 [Salix suchowensis]|uniref:Secreted protein n=1 Tax=Salix suchowensis TaxID=1278906 RepID=A0ABQ8ZG25_9ROSI|nr:hypothetical protein OIU77_002435 [Salix suchowensis]